MKIQGVSPGYSQVQEGQTLQTLIKIPALFVKILWIDETKTN